MLLFFALLVLLIACYAEDVCQYWSSPLTPPGIFGGIICLDQGIHTLSAEKFWQLAAVPF